VDPALLEKPARPASEREAEGVAEPEEELAEDDEIEPFRSGLINELVNQRLQNIVKLRLFASSLLRIGRHVIDNAWL
jgi:hypothetical protein